jgi:ubiquinone/menaquinone biosynthesis C-methylase UbiE
MLNNITKTENVKQQYSDDKNLSARMNLHIKHSTNKKGFFPWLWEQYELADNSDNSNHFDNFENCRILELGCGNGAQWENKIDSLPNSCNVILSDFSAGMVNTVREKYGEYKNFSFRQIDIQDIDFPDETFDIVIANHMLYHVPDLPKALSEAKRVLKTGGKFYSSTNGKGGMELFLHEAFKYFNPDTELFTGQWAFNLQNGFEILSGHFSDVKRIDYEDSLSITETQDLMDWIKSTISMSISSYSEKDLDGLFDYFEDIRKKDGAINIPKEAGLFISVK